MKRYLSYILLAILVVSFFKRGSLKGAGEIYPELLNDPIQAELTSAKDIELSSGKYLYWIKPLYDYTISGLVVSKMNYRWFDIYNYAQVFPLDLCLIWGGNAKNRVFEQSISFYQDCRFCQVQWRGQVDFNMNELSNNHLIFADKRVERKAFSIHRGDQVQLKGMLANVKCKLVGKAGDYDISSGEWKTSAKREDSGAGACEVIYVEEVTILSRANIEWHFLYYASLYSLIALFGWKVYRFFTTKTI